MRRLVPCPLPTLYPALFPTGAGGTTLNFTLPSQISTNVLQVTNVTTVPLVTILMDLTTVSVTAATLGTDKPVKVYGAFKISRASCATRIRKTNSSVVFHINIGREDFPELYCWTSKSRFWESQRKHHKPIRMVVS